METFWGVLEFLEIDQFGTTFPFEGNGNITNEMLVGSWYFLFGTTIPFEGNGNSSSVPSWSRTCIGSELLSRLKGMETWWLFRRSSHQDRFGTTIPLEGNVLAVSYRLSAVRKEKYSDVIRIMPTSNSPLQLNRIRTEGWRCGRVAEWK